MDNIDNNHYTSFNCMETGISTILTECVSTECVSTECVSTECVSTECVSTEEVSLEGISTEDSLTENASYVEYITSSMLDMTKLSPELKISTICFTIRLNTDINFENVRQYMKFQLNKNSLLELKTNKNEVYTLLSTKKKEKKLKNFYNSIQMILSLGDNCKINMKIFHNGAVQSSGCKSPYDCNRAIQLLINLLSSKIYLPDGNKIRYISNPIRITNSKIDMINSHFKYNKLTGVYINREKLHELLLKLKIYCQYEKCNHAGVHIEHCPTNKTKPNHIIIFEKKSILITASKNEDHIMQSYNFIVDILNKYQLAIIKFPEPLIYNLSKTDKYKKYTLAN